MPLLVLDNPALEKWLTTHERFNPDELRVPGGEHGGEWTATAVLKDSLKLAGKIDLGHDEKLVGSDKVVGDGGALRLALTEHHGVRSLRLGIGGPEFGGRHDDAGPWRGGPDPTAQINAERKRLRDERDSIEAELNRLNSEPHADPARKAKLQARYDEIDNMDTGALGEVYPAGYTAKLDQGSAEWLRSTLADALAAGKKKQAELDTAYEAGKTEPPRPDRGYWVFAEGSVPGEWADVHYQVYLDDPSVGVETHVAAVPHGQNADDVMGSEQMAQLEPAEAQKLIRLLGRYTSTIPPTTESQSALAKWLEAWDPAKHPRNPPGSPGGGRFRSMVDRLKDAIEEHARRGGGGHPFDRGPDGRPFEREQLRRAAKSLNIELARGEHRDSIAQKLLDHLHGETGTQQTPAPRPPRPTRPAAPQRLTPRQRAAAAARAATVASLTEEQLWREHDDVDRRRAAAIMADAHWWQDDWDGAAELRAALRRYGRGEGSIGELSRVGEDVLARHHLRRELHPGQRVRYDPATMEPSTNFAQDGRHPLEPGDPVEVTGPGYRYTDGRVEARFHARARPVGGAAVTQRPRPDSGPRHARPAARPAGPSGPAKLMLDSETDVPPAATMFDRAAAAYAGASFWEEHPVDPRPFQQILSGDMAGLRVYGMTAEYGQTAGGGDVLRMMGRLERHDGRDVGTFTVTFKRDTTGKITAYHDYLQLERDQQGSGFANEYGLRLLTWYRESGVNEMTLHANIDVGGYAWARMGFSWTNAAETSNIGDRLASILGRHDPHAAFRGAPDADEQVRLGRDLLERMRRARTLDEYPTPYEISQLGRWSGAGRDDMWVGKVLLLGSSWHGRLTLNEVENR